MRGWTQRQAACAAKSKTKNNAWLATISHSWQGRAWSHIIASCPALFHIISSGTAKKVYIILKIKSPTMKMKSNQQKNADRWNHTRRNYMINFQGNEEYIASDELIRSVNIAAALKKPLLVKGEPERPCWQRQWQRAFIWNCLSGTLSP